MQHFLYEDLQELDNKGLRRSLRAAELTTGRVVRYDGRDLLNFCSNNYLGLADDARLKQAAVDAIQQYGWGSGASRLVSGHSVAHEQLEQRLAQFKGTESSLVFNTGYMANVGIIAGLFGRGDIIFADRLNHASIIDGILLSQAEYKRYPHRDMAALETMLKSASGFRRKAIITDSVFSMDGDIAPLDVIVDLARRYDCMVMVDEAHALGVLGTKGRGAVEHFGLEGKVEIQMGTLSKAAGSLGAYCCGSKSLTDYLLNHARSFIYTTALPPAAAAASMAGLEIIANDPQRRHQLWQNTNYILRELKGLGFDTLETQTPIIPLVVKDAQRALVFSRQLFAAGIFVSAIRPPTVPANTARLRLTVTAVHTRDDLDNLLENLRRIGKELCLI